LPLVISNSQYGFFSPTDLYLLNISGMMHTIPKVSSKNMVKAQTFGTFPRFFEKILFSNLRDGGFN